jgi:23S rRNA pseudouridine955/2504/2580 synthase
VNRRRAGADYRLALGDRVRVPPIRVEERVAESVAPPREFAVAFEDDALIVIDKPAGVAVHGGSGISFGVIEQLRRARPQAKFLELAHRIDRETSGLLIVAKKRSALTNLHDRFREGGIDKRYLALVRGRWRNALQHVRLPLHKYLNAEGERRVSVSSEGQAAHSIVRLVARWENFSLVEVELKTGRTHQIRVHFQHIRYPLVGDVVYRRGTRHGLSFPRQALHATELSLIHPGTHQRVTWNSPLPRDMKKLVEQLRND